MQRRLALLSLAALTAVAFAHPAAADCSVNLRDSGCAAGTTPTGSGDRIYVDQSGGLDTWIAPLLQNFGGALTSAQMLALANGHVYQGNGSGHPVDVSLSAAIDSAIGSTRGAVLERGAGGWTLVTPGTSGFVLTSNGASADPTYQAAAGGGAVSSVFTRTGGVTAQSGDYSFSQISGSPSAAQLATNLSAAIDSAIGSIRGAVLERGASGWALIAPSSTAGLVLASNGTGADPSYQSVSGTGCIPGGTNGQLLSANGSGGCDPNTPGAGINVDTTAHAVSLAVPNVTKTTAYTVAAGDMAGTINLGTCSASCTLTIPAISSTVMPNKNSVCYADQGSGTLWNISSTPTINGLPSTTVGRKGGGCLVSNGTSLDWQPGHIGGDFASYATLTAALDAKFGSTQGMVLYRDTGAWSALSPPGSGGTYYLTISGGGGNNPQWTSSGPSTPCNDLKADHQTATGSPAVYACDVVMQPMFGI